LTDDLLIVRLAAGITSATRTVVEKGRRDGMIAASRCCLSSKPATSSNLVLPALKKRKESGEVKATAAAIGHINQP